MRGLFLPKQQKATICISLLLVEKENDLKFPLKGGGVICRAFLILILAETFQVRLVCLSISVRLYADVNGGKLVSPKHCQQQRQNSATSKYFLCLGWSGHTYLYFWANAAEICKNTPKIYFFLTMVIGSKIPIPTRLNCCRDLSSLNWFYFGDSGLLPPSWQLSNVWQLCIFVITFLRSYSSSANISIS